VETVTDQSTGTSTAAGNSYQATTDGADLEVRSSQGNSGQVGAANLINATGSTGAQAGMTTTAAGNSGYAGVTGGVMTGVFNQTSNGASVAASGRLEAETAQAGDIGVTTQAQGDSHVFTVSNGTAGLAVNQANSAEVTSDGGTVLGLATGTAQFDASTQGNSVGLTGDSWSGARMVVTQDNATDLTQAAQFTAYGQVQAGETSATAAGNAISAVNEGFLLDTTSTQHNRSYVRAQAETAAASYGSLSVSANGVGNSAVMGDIGGQVVLDTSQVNETGGIEVIATLSGGDGYDTQATANAAGNSVTGYACADCNGRMTVNNSQVNSAGVGATSTTTITGQARSVSGAASAVGNSATYYVSKPSGS
jgi:hypothetical protein